jgi:hypothetical protein
MRIATFLLFLAKIFLHPFSNILLQIETIGFPIDPLVLLPQRLHNFGCGTHKLIYLKNIPYSERAYGGLNVKNKQWEKTNNHRRQKSLLFYLLSL